MLDVITLILFSYNYYYEIPCTAIVAVFAKYGEKAKDGVILITLKK